MMVSPIVGFALAFVVMLAILWIFRHRNAGPGQPRLPARADRLRLGDGARARPPRTPRRRWA